MSQAGRPPQPYLSGGRKAERVGLHVWAAEMEIFRVELTCSEGGGKKKRKSKTTIAPLASGSFPYHPEEEYIDRVRSSVSPLEQRGGRWEKRR